MAKYGMSLCVLGMAEEFRARRHRRERALAAHGHRHGGRAQPPRRVDVSNKGRTPEIMADAAHAILTKDVHYTGHFAIDDEVLAAEGVTDLSKYDVVPGAELLPDFFVD